eukprot:s1173_g3.t1
MSGVLSTRAYREYAVDGMPACRFCKVRFTRVEGLKKHIRRGCPKFGCPHPSPEEDQPGVVTAPEVQVASGQGELNRQSALQITPEDPAEQPLIHNLSFRSSLQISWRQPLRDPAFRKKMSTYCVLCGQWISNVGPGCKQHLRLMHAAEWTHSSAALARITSLGLDTASPCTYCGKQAKDIRKHLRGCVPVSQPSLAALVVIAQERAVGAPDVERDGAGGKGHPGQAGDRTGLLDQPPEEKDDSAEGRPPKWYRQNQGKGHSQDGWQKWKSQKRGWEPAENAHQARSSGQAMDEKVQGLLTTLTCAVLRHETDLQLWRADTSFVIYVDICPHSCLQSIRDAAANWEELFANGKVTIMALKTALTMGIMNKLKEQMEALQLDEAKMQKCREAGWMGEGRQALDPAWFYHGTGGPPLAHHDPEGPRPGHPLPLDGRHPFALQVYEDTERGSGGRGRAHTTILKDLDLAIRYLSMEGILLRFKCTKTLSEDLEGEVVPFMLTISMRTQEADDLHRIFKSLAGCASCKLLGLRVKPERGQRSQLSKQLEQSYLSQDFCEWKPAMSRARSRSVQ